MAEFFVYLFLGYAALFTLMGCIAFYVDWFKKRRQFRKMKSPPDGNQEGSETNRD